MSGGGRDRAALMDVIRGMVMAIDVYETCEECPGRFAFVIGLRDRATGAEVAGFAPEGEDEKIDDAEAEHLVRIVGQALVNRADGRKGQTITSLPIGTQKPKGGAER